mgnify:FL=1
MLKILLLKLFFLVCAVLVCINIFELIPHQILSFDFFTQLSLLIICIGFFMVLKLPLKANDKPQTLSQDQNPLNNINHFSSLLMCKVGMSAFVVTYFVRLFVL